MSKLSDQLSGLEKDRLWRDDGIDYDWLIAQLEGEAFTKQGPKNFVLSSQAELQAYESLHHLRRILKSCGEVNLPESGDYYQKQNDQIMKKIMSQTPKQETGTEKRSKILKRLVTQAAQKNQFAMINLLLLALAKFT
jgi:hypothetical protein